MQKSIMKLYYCLLVFILYDVTTFVTSQPTPSENFPHRAPLNRDESVWLFWKIENVYITFEMHGQTTGWVGIGISPNGGMIGADIFVGWVKDGVANVTDRHGLSSNTFPPLDDQQDVTLLGGEERDGWTRIKFRRQIAGCEENVDITLTTSTTKIIWALGSNDPQGEDIIAANYHRGTRGVRNLLILEAGGGGSTISEEDTDSFSLLNNRLPLPAVDTYYNCKLFEFPRLSSKRHVIKIEPVIQPGNENRVHHILLYQCSRDPQDLSNVGRSHQCYTRNMPDDFRRCNLIIHGWAIGGGPLIYPDHVGFPIGTEDAPRYVLMEVHYDNPTLTPGIVDSSGLRMVYTRRENQLRQYDAGIFETGRLVHPYTHLIPPNSESFSSYGECPSGCIGPAINHIGRRDIRLIGSFLHTHLLGRAVTLRHVDANGTELPFIAQDNAYDFNYQEAKIFPQEVTFNSGDSIQLVCTYNSVGREGMTLGGFGTMEEMCLAYVLYYPKIPLTSCSTTPTPQQLYHFFGVLNSTFLRNSSADRYSASLSDILVLEPERLANQTLEEVVNAVKWTEEVSDAFSLNETTHYRIHRCLASVNLTFVEHANPVRIRQPYTPPLAQCLAPTQPPITTTSSGQLIRGSFSLAVAAIIGLVTIL